MGFSPLNGATKQQIKEGIPKANQKGKNAVLIGEEDWKAIEETLHLMAIPGMAESIIEGGKTAIEDCLEENEVDW